MHRRLAALTIPLALFAVGFVSRDAFAAPLMQPVVGAGEVLLQRVELRRTKNPLKHCFKRSGARSCQGVAAGPDNASAPHPAALPGENVGSAASPESLPLPNSLPAGTGASRNTANRPVERSSSGSAAGNGLKFTGGMGVPTNRATLEGTLSPYQLPNGNTSASTSGKLSNGIEAQGMHFGFEFHY